MLPVPRHRGSQPYRRCLLVSLTGNKEGSEGFMVLRVKSTPTRFPTNSLYTPMYNTTLHSIPSVCRPWGAKTLSRHNGMCAGLDIG